MVVMLMWVREVWRLLMECVRVVVMRRRVALGILYANINRYVTRRISKKEPTISLSTVAETSIFSFSKTCAGEGEGDGDLVNDTSSGIFCLE